MRLWVKKISFYNVLSIKNTSDSQDEVFPSLLVDRDGVVYGRSLNLFMGPVSPSVIVLRPQSPGQSTSPQLPPLVLTPKLNPNRTMVSGFLAHFRKKIRSQLGFYLDHLDHGSP